MKKKTVKMEAGHEWGCTRSSSESGKVNEKRWRRYGPQSALILEQCDKVVRKSKGRQRV